MASGVVVLGENDVEQRALLQCTSAVDSPFHVEAGWLLLQIIEIPSAQYEHIHHIPESLVK